jgi:5-methyltetrahydrofolate--homocysteine methyltransferase
VAQVADASLAPGFLENMLNPAKLGPFRAELEALHAKNREIQKRKRETAEYLSLADARSRAFRSTDPAYTPPVPVQTGPAELVYSIPDLVPYIDWTYFFLAWEMKGSYPAILDDPAVGIEARKLLADARALLAKAATENLLQIRGVWGLTPAASEGDDILLYTDESRSAVRARLPCLRQQRKKDDGTPYLCHADYLAAAASGKKDWLGSFAVTAGIGLAESVAAFAATGDEYSVILLKILADRLAEAAAEKLHEEVRKKYWAYSPDEHFSPADILRVKYRGIRPAPGYPPCPDHREKALIFELLDAERRTGMTLTESFMMIPAASVSGWYFSHSEARYFAVGKITLDQAQDFASRRGEDLAITEKWLRNELAYGG